MSKIIKIGIVGYGNLGRGVEAAITQSEDMQLVGVFSRRDPQSIQLLDSKVPVHPLSEVANFSAAVDVMILCGGSKSDLPEQGPELAKLFNVVDSFDTHAKIPEYFTALDKSAMATNHIALLSVGWDPGMFSLSRLYGEAILPVGATYTFWGKGLSQGHSDAIRRIAGVKGGVQYTIPSEDAIERVRSGELPQLTTREKHKRECFVVLDAGADAEFVKNSIVNMPDYFSDYDTTVNFIDAATLEKEHNSMAHGGFVIRSGVTGENTKQTIEFSLNLQSNPEFTASVLVAYARAVYRLSQSGVVGAKTVFDIAPGLLSIKSAAQLREELL